jgi:hypothetical protein
MAEITAHVYYWTPAGMREGGGPDTYGSVFGYVEVREVERLLEEAHRKGWEKCDRDTQEKLKQLIRGEP